MHPEEVQLEFRWPELQGERFKLVSGIGGLGLSEVHAGLGVRVYVWILIIRLGLCLATFTQMECPNHLKTNEERCQRQVR